MGKLHKVESTSEGTMNHSFSFLPFTTSYQNDPAMVHTGLKTLKSKIEEELFGCLPLGHWPTR